MANRELGPYGLPLCNHIHIHNYHIFSCHSNHHSNFILFNPNQFQTCPCNLIIALTIGSSGPVVYLYSLPLPIESSGPMVYLYAIIYTHNYHIFSCHSNHHSNFILFNTTNFKHIHVILSSYFSAQYFTTQAHILFYQNFHTINTFQFQQHPFVITMYVCQCKSSGSRTQE